MPSHPLHSFQALLRHPSIAPLLAACGATECHLVGGALRDRALGLPIHDVDAVVARRGREIAEMVAAALPARFVALGGKEFAAFRLVARDFTLDLWDRAGTPLYQDLERRDFTVNSMAMEARGGEMVDPFDGQGDLGRRLLRATTPASFSGDPLRVLRLPRLLLQLPRFAAEPGTLQLARQSAPRLADVAAERVRDEIAAILARPEAHRGLALLIALDLYPGLFLGTPGEPGSAGTALGELEALPGCILELRRLGPAGIEASEAVDARAARLAALFRNLPAPAEALQRSRDAGFVTRQASEEAAVLLRWEALPEDEVGCRRFLYGAGALWPTAACAAGARAAVLGRLEAWRGALARVVDLAQREGALLLNPPRLLSGAEVQELLGIGPGPEVGRALAAIRAAQVEGTVRTREEAILLLGKELPREDP